MSRTADGRKPFLVTYDLLCAFHVFLQPNVSSSKMNTGPCPRPLAGKKRGSWAPTCGNEDIRVPQQRG